MYLCEAYTLRLTLNLIDEFLSFAFVKPSRAFEHPKHLQQNTFVKTLMYYTIYLLVYWVASIT